MSIVRNSVWLAKMRSLMRDMTSRYSYWFWGIGFLVLSGATSSCVPLRSVSPIATVTEEAQVAPNAVPTAAPSAGPISGGSGWRRVFTDEFTSGVLDRSKWTRCYWWDNGGCTNLGNPNLNWYLPGNISFRNGALVLTAREQQVRGINGRLFPYTSGMVTTGRDYAERHRSDRFSFTYGYVEIRARIPSGRGLWPALWLMPSTHRDLPEIDIMEVIGHRPNVLEMHFHYRADAGQKRTANRRVTVSDLSRNWHVYGLEWSPNAIIWYLDGVEQWRFTNASAIPREPMYLIMNLAVGGAWPGSPNSSTQFPAEFLIDYVRIWQRAQ